MKDEVKGNMVIFGLENKRNEGTRKLMIVLKSEDRAIWIARFRVNL
jgi:hypothetical protein